MSILNIDVTADDIAAGVRNDACGCPIALALKRLGYERPGVGKEVIWPWFAESYIALPLPDHGRAFVEDFDNARPVQPFSFTLEVPA